MSASREKRRAEQFTNKERALAEHRDEMRKDPDGQSVDYPEDVVAIRGACPSDTADLTDLEVDALWSRFSSENCASWLILSDGTLGEFKDWLPRKEQWNYP